MKTRNCPWRRVLTTWKEPEPGSDPVCEAALAILRNHRQEKLLQVEGLNTELENLQKLPQKTVQHETLIQSILKKRDWLTIQAERYQPEVLLAYRSGQGDLSRPEFRYLRHVDFRERDIPLLIHRTKTMFVIPDVIPPHLTPQIQVELCMREQETILEAGIPISPSQALEPFDVVLTSFDVNTHHYTLLLVDPDDPFPETRSYQTKLHWFRANVPVRLSMRVDPSMGDCFVEYLPPHPQPGTKHHRYVVMACRQSQELKKEDLLKHLAQDREVEVKVLLQQLHLTVEGWTFFRAAYDPSVDVIYRDRLRLPVPRYVHPSQLK